MELICLRTTRAGSCHRDWHLVVISLGKMQFIHHRGWEKIIELNFLQVQINKKIKLNSTVDRNITETCGTFFCLPLSLWLPAWWETAYLNDHEIWILFTVILQYIYCRLLKCSPFPVEWFQTSCFLTDYGLKNHCFLLAGFKRQRFPSWVRPAVLNRPLICPQDKRPYTKQTEKGSSQASSARGQLVLYRGKASVIKRNRPMQTLCSRYWWFCSVNMGILLSNGMTCAFCHPKLIEMRSRGKIRSSLLKVKIWAQKLALRSSKYSDFHGAWQRLM